MPEAGFSSLLLIGCGRMGSAMLASWMNEGGIKTKRGHIAIVEPSARAREDITRRYSVHGYESIESVDKGFRPEIIVFAVKPQSLDEMILDYAKRFRDDGPLILSIAAGKTLAYYASFFGNDARIVRAMPNTPAAIGMGMTVACNTPAVTPQDKERATALLDKTGVLEWVEDETHMNAVTALSGSGPAYLFLFMESLVKAGMDAGLSQELARKLVVETVRGSAELARQSPDELSTLREHVTSKGGTTEAALSVLKTGSKLESLLKMAVYAAIKRAEELA